MGHDDIQVFAVPFELKISEIGEDRASRGRRMLVFWVWSRLRGFEFKPKCSEAGQCGEGGDYCLGWNVPRMRNVFKEKFDEVSAKQR